MHTGVRQAAAWKNERNTFQADTETHSGTLLLGLWLMLMMIIGIAFVLKQIRRFATFGHYGRSYGHFATAITAVLQRQLRYGTTAKRRGESIWAFPIVLKWLFSNIPNERMSQQIHLQVIALDYAAHCSANWQSQPWHDAALIRHCQKAKNKNRGLFIMSVQ